MRVGESSIRFKNLDTRIGRLSLSLPNSVADGTSKLHTCSYLNSMSTQELSVNGLKAFSDIRKRHCQLCQSISTNLLNVTFNTYAVLDFPTSRLSCLMVDHLGSYVAGK